MATNEGNGASWFVEILLQNRFNANLKRRQWIFVDEQSVARYFDLNGLLEKPPYEPDEDDDLDSDAYFVTYSSDSRYLIRTLISKSFVVRPTPPITRRSRVSQPPLSYSSDQALASAQRPNGENADNFWKSGSMTLALVITKYQFKKCYDSQYGLTISLIVDEGQIAASNEKRPPEEFSRLWFNSDQLYLLFKVCYSYSNVSESWEASKIRPKQKEKRGSAQSGDASRGESSRLLSALCDADSDVVPDDDVASDGPESDWKGLSAGSTSEKSTIILRSSAAAMLKPPIVDLVTPDQSPNASDSSGDEGPSMKMPRRRAMKNTTGSSGAHSSSTKSGNTGKKMPKKHRSTADVDEDYLKEKLRLFKLNDLKEKCVEFWCDSD